MRVGTSGIGAALLVVAAASPPGARAIVGGELRNPDDWPASLVLEVADGRCSATAVGDRTVLTAAHCVLDSEKMRVVGAKFVTALTSCTRHPDYSQDVTADFALCVTEEPLPISTYERINTDPGRLYPGRSILLTGNGCQLEAGLDSGFGELNAATTTIVSLPTTGMYTQTRGDAALCYGDAGGGAFILYDEESDEQAERVLVGVNSRSNLKDTSYLATASRDRFVQWARQWAAENQVIICGLVAEGATVCGDKPSQTARAEDWAPAEKEKLPAEYIVVEHEAGERVREVVERTCGPQGEEYYGLLEKYGRTADGEPLSREQRLAVAGRIHLLSCLPEPPPRLVGSATRPPTPPVEAPSRSSIANLSETHAELQASGNHCTSTDDQRERYPYDLEALLDVLGSIGEPKQVEVLIADSGVYDLGGYVFTRKGLVFDTWETFRERQTPLLTAQPLLAHGTQVASLVLGGPTFARFHALAGSPRIRLVIRRIYVESTTPDGDDGITVEPTTFTEMVRDARRLAPIVNLSLKRERPIEEIAEHYLGKSSDVLFVVAAGNYDGNLESNPVYPANYGGNAGDGHFNVLTVAASEPGQARRLAPFSNWSPRVVDIAAPGCNVPVLTWNPAEEALVTARMNGTSMAAPQVTFAAALVKSGGGETWKPFRIKRRLLSSSDLNPNLLTQVEDGRQLNVVKAVALHDDLVELADGKLIRGRIRFIEAGKYLREHDVIEFCDGHVSVPPQRILKLAPRFSNRDGVIKTLLYYKDKHDNYLLVRKECPRPPGLSVAVHDSRGRDHVLRMDEVKDLVRKGA